MRKRTWPACTPTICIVLLVCALTSCVDLSQVTSFADAATQAGTALTPLVNDLRGSCERLNSYAPEGATLRDCAQYDKLEKGISSAQGVLVNYMQALAQLSADKKVTFSQGTTDLAGKLQAAGLDATASTSATGLAGKLADAVTNGYRRKKLAQFIHAENKDVQTLTHALSDIFQKDYKQLLTNEEVAMDSYYQRALQKPNRDREPLAAVLVVHEERQARDELKARVQAAEAYGKVMRSIADGHQKLDEAGQSLNTKDLFQFLGRDIGDISSSLNDVYSAFK